MATPDAVAGGSASGLCITDAQLTLQSDPLRIYRKADRGLYASRHMRTLANHCFATASIGGHSRL